MTIVLTELQHRRIEENSKTKVQAFQRKLYLKAKQNPKYKFYCLYDKVFRKDMLEEAYKRVKINKGAAGIDGTTFKELEGIEEKFINEIQTELKGKTYRPNRLRKVEIPKKNGKTRILKIPTIKDRVVQMVVKLIIEPIFEADFKDCSYGYRPKKSAHQAIGKMDKELYREMYKLKDRRKEVKSIDLAECFNAIPHKELIQIIAKRIIDRQMLKLIKMMLKAGVMKREENEEDKGDKGTPQGGVLSPLLANIYLDQIDKYWEKEGKLSKMIRYADDVVIILDKREKQKYKEFLEYIERNLKLKVNNEKTKTENIKDGVEYLGFRMKIKTSRRQKQYLSIEPCKESLKGIKQKIKEIVKNKSIESTESVIRRTNSVLRGWQQYFDNISMGKTRGQIKKFTEERLAKMITKRNKRKKISWKLVGHGKLYRKHGLYNMQNLGRKFG